MCEMESRMALYGYARVSTDGQSLAAQLAELKAAKCEKIFQHTVSDRLQMEAGSACPRFERDLTARRDAGEALTDIARTFGVSHTTIGRLTAAPSA
jgi:hypothetical protein